MRLLWQSGGDCGAMMRRSYPQPVIAPFPIYYGAAGGRGKYGRAKSKSDTISRTFGLSGVRLIHVVLTGANKYRKELVLCRLKQLSIKRMIPW